MNGRNASEKPMNAVQWLKDHLLTPQFLRFLGVGATAAATQWVARIFLSEAFSFSTAVLIAYGIGMATAFALNRLFVFQDAAKPVEQQVAWFVIVNLAFLPVVWAVSIVLADDVLPLLGVSLYRESVAHAIAIAVPTFGSFLLHKFLTFRTVVTAK